MTINPAALTTAGIVALSGGLTVAIAGFKNIVQFFKNIQNLLFIQETIPYNEAILRYLLMNGRIGPWYKYKWTSPWLWHKDVGQHRATLVRHPPVAAVVFLGWRPVAYTQVSSVAIELRHFRWLFGKHFFADVAMQHITETDERACASGYDVDEEAPRVRYTIIRCRGKRGDTPARYSSENTPTPPERDKVENSGQGRPGYDAYSVTYDVYRLAIDVGYIPHYGKDNLSDVGKRFSARNYFLTEELAQCEQELIRWRKLDKWYADRGISWKRGWLLNGIPGSGKTSFVRYLAERHDMPLIVMDLASMTNADLTKAWENTVALRPPCIVLFEDLDAVFNGRVNITQGQDMAPGVSFDHLLNILDGCNECNGVFTIITTNHPENIDPAIAAVSANEAEMPSRPGRVDRVIQIGKAHPDVKHKIAAKILNEWPDLIPCAMDAGHEDTAAQMQERCVRMALERLWAAERTTSA